LWRLCLVALVLGGGVLIYLDAYIQREFSGKKWAVPALVYGRALELYAGAPLSREQLLTELSALGYRHTLSDRRPGSFSTQGELVSIHTRGFHFWDGDEPRRRLRVRFGADSIASLADERGGSLAITRLEPVHIGGIYPAHNEDRILVRLADVPPFLIDTLVAVEDRDYFGHHGISLRGIARALWVNLRSGSVEQGGSTLTQQLVKNYFLTRERSLVRKAAEAVMAILLEFHYSKEEILEAYLNEIYLGQDGHRAIHGFGLASQYYFNRPLTELDGNQIALLVAMVRGPSYYDPWRHPERARERRDRVLNETVEAGKLDPEVAVKLAALPLAVGDRAESRSRFYPAYLDLVRRQLRRDYSDEDLSSEGLQIFTGLDPIVQRTAEASLRDTLERIERDYAARGKPVQGLEGAVIVTRVDSGEVLAVVGGRRSRYAGFNRALDAARPVGSLMKPAVYLSALQGGKYTLLSALDDGPVTYKGANRQVWSPRNYDRKDHGMVRLYRALAESYNQATARLGLELGVSRVVATIRRLGVQREVPEVPAIFLGAVSLTPLEVAGMYQTIASGGFSTPLRAIREVLDADGRPLTRYPVAVDQTLSQAAIYLLEYALRAVVREGTATAAYRRLPAGFAVAGKTGTTDDQRDSWFAGYAGDLLAVVWVGRDDNGTTPLTGSTGALPVWATLMAGASRVPLRSTVPEGVVEAWVDDAGGGLSAQGCPGARKMPFLVGTEPRYAAPCAAPRAPDAPAADEEPRRGFWERLFGR